MRKKCPPGIFCIENTTLIFLLVVFLLILGILYFVNYNNFLKDYKDLVKEKVNQDNHRAVYHDVHHPPLKDNEFHPELRSCHSKGLPINIKTRGGDVEYRQLGILTRGSGKEMILPLMGRPLYSNRSKWQYYTGTDKLNMVKLPVSSNGRSCTGEYGCDELSNGDNIYVEGYNDLFKVTIYDNSRHQYIPFL
jgi:hypothetical protein